MRPEISQARHQRHNPREGEGDLGGNACEGVDEGSVERGIQPRPQPPLQGCEVLLAGDRPEPCANLLDIRPERPREVFDAVEARREPLMDFLGEILVAGFHDSEACSQGMRRGLGRLNLGRCSVHTR